MKEIQTDYEAFGEEWEKEMMKLSKKQLIALYKNLATVKKFAQS